MGFIDLFLWVVEIFLGLRFVLRLFAENPNAPFVPFIYNFSTPLLKPFRGTFPIRVIKPDIVVEFSTMFAIIIYALFAYLIIELIPWIVRITRVETR